MALQTGDSGLVGDWASKSLVAAGFELGFPYFELGICDFGIERFATALVADTEHAQIVPLVFEQSGRRRSKARGRRSTHHRRALWDVSVIPALIELVPAFDGGPTFFSMEKWHVRGTFAPSVDRRISRGVARVHIIIEPEPTADHRLAFLMMQLVGETPMTRQDRLISHDTTKPPSLGQA